MQKLLVAGSFFFLFLLLISAQPVQALEDTTYKNLSASVIKKSADPTRPGKTGNVVFPSLFEKEADECLAYIEKFSVSRRGYLMRTYARSKKFFPKAHSILKKYNVPSEFAVLLALESAFNPNAVSKAGAVGYWQIMDEVAKEYGLRIVEDQHKRKTKAAAKKTTGKTSAKKKPAIDDRKNFSVSTHTAAKYLKARMRNLDNNWLLIAASYNWGVGNVWNAIERSGKKNPTFWDIRDQLPAETRSYVMNFITLNVIFTNYEKFASNQLYFRSEKPAPGLPKAEKDRRVAIL